LSRNCRCAYIEDKKPQHKGEQTIWLYLLTAVNKARLPIRSAPTLTDVGERSHLTDVNLDIHIFDVTNEMRWQELNNVVLVGHSYAGMVVTGVAEKMERSIASIVLLDAFFPETGEALVG
jgi:hypothetical protein